MKKITKLFFVSILCLSSLAALFAFYKAPRKVNASLSLNSGEELDTNIDYVSISDLTFNELTGQSELFGNANTLTTFAGYSNTNTNKNLVFKFKYELNENTSLSNNDGKCVRIHLHVDGNEWDVKNSLMFRPDNIFFWSTTTNGWNTHKTLDAGSTYEIEFGRIAILNSEGAATGDYKVYYSVNGEVYDEIRNTYNVANIDNKIFFNIGSDHSAQNRILDANLSYEEPQYVSISDLKDGGNSVGSSVTSRKLYTYDTTNQPTNKSTVFVAKIDYTTAEDSQIYITSKSWAQAGYMWIHPTKCYFGTNDATGAQTGNAEVKLATALKAGNTYEIEFGRLAVMNGSTFTGKYHVYFKLDGNTIFVRDQAIEANAAAAGGIQFTGDGNFAYLDAYRKEEAKYIDMSDLTANKDTTISNNTDLSYENTDHTANYSIIFRCKYTANELKNNQIHLSSSENKWDSTSSFILNNNNGTMVHLGKTKGDGTADGYKDITLDTAFEANKTYDIEYGRLANLIGDKFLGTYYCYLKINGKVVAEGSYVIPAAIREGNVVFITSDGANTFTDCSPADVFEKADIVSVNELKLNGESVTDTEELVAQANYTYSSTAAHKSTVFKFKLTVSDATSKTQLHLGQGYTSNCIWLRNDNTFIQKDDSKYVKGNAIFTAAGSKNIEVGKLYVLEGKHAGKYYIYIKADGTLIGGYFTNNTYNQSVLFNTSAYGTIEDCCKAGHTPGEQVAAVASTCSTHGTVAYYECTVCGKKFSDQACTQQLTSIEAALAQHKVEDGECTVCHAKTVPEFTSVTDGTKVTFENQIYLWKHSTAVVEFDANSSSLYVDLVSPTVDGRASEKKQLTGVEVLGITGTYYHYSFNVKDLATNNTNGFETLDGMRFRSAVGYANFKVTGDDSILEAADNINVNDLSYLNGSACGKVVSLNSTKVQWNAKAEHKSVIFTFNYTLDSIPEKSDYSWGQYHFNNNWTDNCIWIRKDKVFIYKDDKNPTGGLAPFDKAGTYKVEIGKVYIKSGDDAGKYYLFCKVDGKVVNQYITANDYNNNYLFCTCDDGSQWVDINFVPDVYETADVITVRDLKNDGAQMPNILTLDEPRSYTYTSTAERKSVVFKFKYTVTEIPSKSDYDYTQIYFDEPWGQNCVWIRNDNTCIKKDGDSYVTGPAIFTEAGTKEIEVGEVYVADGDNKGKFYIYIKADGKLVASYYSENNFTKAEIFFSGKDGSKVYSYDYVECTTTHTLGEKVDAVSPTCEADGTVAYYWCSNCGKYFSDAECQNELTSIVDPKHHTPGTLVAAVAPDCEHDGTVAYYQCSGCQKYFSDAECQNELTSIVDPKHHTPGTLVAAVAPDCEHDGTVAYYQCSGCQKYFSDAECQNELTSIVDPKHHTIGELVPAVAPDCEHDGTIAYYTCTGCTAKLDAQGNVLESVVDPKHHTPGTQIAAVAPTCEENGTIAHYHCSACGKNFSDAECQNELESVVDPKHHVLSKVDAKAATCDKAGNIEYYHCSECSKNFSDEAGTVEVTNVVLPKAHKLTKVAAKAATCTEDGNIEYYHCSECNKNYADAEGKSELADVTEPAKGHKYGDDGKCSVCGAADPNYQEPTPAKKKLFGCKSSMAVSAIISLVGVAGVLVIKRRKENF